MTDYIRRDEALSFPFANGHYDHKNANEHFIYGCESYKEWLEGLPTADVRENVHGYWMPALDYSNGNEDIECSACGEWFKSIELCGRFGEPNYCPCCGAKMDGGDKQ